MNLIKRLMGRRSNSVPTNPTKPGQGGDDPVLTVLVNGSEVAVIRPSDLPCEVTPRVAVDGPAQVAFRDAGGLVWTHIVPDAPRWLHLSVRVHPNFGCEADAVRTSAPRHASGQPLAPDDLGVRFQPFFLTAAEGAPDLTGRGLFDRGLHYPGHVTPGNILLACICDGCGDSFLAQSFHAGFAELGYFYSDSGGYTLTVDARIEGAPAALSIPDPQMLAALEARLPDAPDGSRFAWLNPFRCPHCGSAYIDFQRFPEMRVGEYCALYLLDHPPIRWDSAG